MKIRGTEFLVGADPEVFVTKGRGGEFICPHHILYGTKRHPQAMSLNTHGQVDGMALEFNISPARDAKQFARFVKEGVGELKWRAEAKGGYIKVQPTAEFGAEEWKKAPAFNKMLGCEPDYNGYTLGLNDPPNSGATFRTGAGHIAIGWGNEYQVTSDYLYICGVVVKEMDAIVGMSSLLFDSDTKRRELYGKAGAFRPKPFGVEYRTLSNKWVVNKELSTYVYRRTIEAVKNVMHDRKIQVPEVQGIINNSNVEEAKYFLNHHKITLPPSKYRMV